MSIIYLGSRSGFMPLTGKCRFWSKWIGCWKLKKESSLVSYKICSTNCIWTETANLLNGQFHILNNLFLIILFPSKNKIWSLNYIYFYQILSVTLNSILRKNWLWRTFLKKNLENHKKTLSYLCHNISFILKS